MTRASDLRGKALTTMSTDILAELAAAGAIVTGRHFVYTSGKHGANYINMDLLLPDAKRMFELCELLAMPFRDQFDTVAAPAVGGVVLAELTALAATTPQRRPAAVWADKTPNGFAFQRTGFSRHLTRRRVLVVEDLLTTGGSLAAVVAGVRLVGGDVIGASVICNRGQVSPQTVGVERLVALSEVQFDVYEVESCPMCRDGVPIVEDIGHGADYRNRMPEYVGGFVSILNERRA